MAEPLTISPIQSGMHQGTGAAQLRAWLFRVLALQSETESALHGVPRWLHEIGDPEGSRESLERVYDAWTTLHDAMGELLATIPHRELDR